MLRGNISECLIPISIPWWTVRWPFKYVNEGQQGLVLRFGKCKRQIEPGKITFVNPITSRLKIIYLKESLIEIAERGYALRDGTLKMGTVICYAVVNARDVNPYFESIECIVRSRTAQMLEEHLSNKFRRQAQTFVHSDVVGRVNKCLSQFGVEVVWLELKDTAID